jgi:competence protein ComEC
MYLKYLEKLTALLDRGSLQEVRWGRRGDVVVLEQGVTARLYNPREPLPDDPNDASLVMRVEFNKVSVLLAGDIGSDIEREIVAAGRPIRSTVLKVAHHGSTSSTSEGFVSAVAPEVAVTSEGAGNAYGHPSANVLARLKMASARVYRTDVSGTVKIITDGQRYMVEVQK